MKGFDLIAVLANPEFVRMLWHGVQMTLIIALGSWLVAMSLAIVLLVMRLAPSRIAGRVVIIIQLVEILTARNLPAGNLHAGTRGAGSATAVVG